MFKSRVLAALLILVMVLGAAAAYLVWRQRVPGVRAALSKELKVIGAASQVHLTLEAARGGVASAEVRIAQGGNSVTAVRRSFPADARGSQSLSVTLDARALGLHEGPATLQIFARDGFWRPLGSGDRAALSVPLLVDLTPPSLDVVSATRYLYLGGGGVVVLRSSDAVRMGVRVGGVIEPAFPAGGTGSGLAVGMVVIPWDLAEKDSSVSAFAEDEAGNIAWRPVPCQIKRRNFPSDVIEIPDRLLTQKLPELLPRAAGLTGDQLLSAFLTVNRDQRKEAEQTKRKLGARTRPKPLWDGVFLQARNSKVFANFAETRTYRYRGREVDREVHFGYDLASVRQAPVAAANSGVVIFAGPLSIYGNAIVVDHGLGLQTLYAHLSRFEVKEGDAVKKGQEMGRTGSTGLALGDHLHFEVLIDGIPVTPLEWWDAKWIRDHILAPLREAGLSLFPSEQTGAGSAPAQAAASAGHRRDSARR